MVTCKNKEDFMNTKDEINWHENIEFLEDENAVCLNYYLLNAEKIKYKVVDTKHDFDIDTQYLKLLSISPLKPTSMLNFSEVI